MEKVELVKVSKKGFLKELANVCLLVRLDKLRGMEFIGAMVPFGGQWVMFVIISYHTYPF